MKQTQFELSDKIEESSLKFKWNLPNEKVIIKLDSQKTFRVFENLLMNIWLNMQCQILECLLIFWK